MKDYNKLLQEIRTEIAPLEGAGQQASYIPALAQVNPDQFGMCISTARHGDFTLGDCNVPFSIQSISKGVYPGHGAEP